MWYPRVSSEENWPSNLPPSWLYLPRFLFDCVSPSFSSSIFAASHHLVQAPFLLTLVVFKSFLLCIPASCLSSISLCPVILIELLFPSALPSRSSAIFALFHHLLRDLSSLCSPILLKLLLIVSCHHIQALFSMCLTILFKLLFHWILLSCPSSLFAVSRTLVHTLFSGSPVILFTLLFCCSPLSCPSSFFTLPCHRLKLLFHCVQPPSSISFFRCIPLWCSRFFFPVSHHLYCCFLPSCSSAPFSLVEAPF